MLNLVKTFINHDLGKYNIQELKIGVVVFYSFSILHCTISDPAIIEKCWPGKFSY